MTKAPLSIRLARKGVLAQAVQHIQFPNFGNLAACLDSNTELFFMETPQEIAKAKSICSECPLIRDCAQWGVRFEEYGVFGGLSAKERHLLRGGEPVMETNQHEKAWREAEFILRASAKEVAMKFSVETRTVLRWRNLLEPMKEVI